MGPVKEVDKTSSGVPTDSFRNAGIFVYYKEPGITEAVEFGGPSSPTFRDQDFLGRQYAEMERWINTIDPEVELNDSGLISRKFGFGLYADGVRKRPEVPVQGVIVFEKGYYESYSKKRYGDLEM
jgi:hypothetical protein